MAPIGAPRSPSCLLALAAMTPLSRLLLSSAALLAAACSSTEERFAPRSSRRPPAARSSRRGSASSSERRWCCGPRPTATTPTTPTCTSSTLRSASRRLRPGSSATRPVARIVGPGRSWSRRGQPARTPGRARAVRGALRRGRHEPELLPDAARPSCALRALHDRPRRHDLPDARPAGHGVARAPGEQPLRRGGDRADRGVRPRRHDPGRVVRVRRHLDEGQPAAPRLGARGPHAALRRAPGAPRPDPRPDPRQGVPAVRLHGRAVRLAGEAHGRALPSLPEDRARRAP